MYWLEIGVFIEKLGFWWKNRGVGGGGIWLKIGVFVEKSGGFQKMGVSWVFGQEIGEK